MRISKFVAKIFLISIFLFLVYPLIARQQTQQYAATSTCTSFKPLTAVTPYCNFNGTTSDRVHLTWAAVSGATSYSVRWWFTDTQTGAKTSTYNECVLRNWFSGTSADMDVNLNSTTKYPHIQVTGWHCWPSSIAATASGVGFAVYANTSSCIAYQSTIGNTACTGTSSCQAPTELSACSSYQNSHASVTFSWTGVPNATKYTVGWNDNGIEGHSSSTNTQVTVPGWKTGIQGTAQIQTSSPCTSSYAPSPAFTFTTADATHPSVCSTTSANTASLTLVLGLPGIGFDALPGVTPKHTTRNVTVELYNASATFPGGPGSNPLASTQGSVLLDTSSDNNAGYFVSTSPIAISLPSQPPANNQYQILIKMPQYTYKLAQDPTNTQSSTVFTLTAGSQRLLPPLVLVPGDVDTKNGQANHLNLNDYTILLSCYGSNATSDTCPVKSTAASGMNLADLNDDGNVDIVDLNLWLRSLSQLQQAQAQGCSTGDCQGD